MTNSGARAAKPITSPSCAGYSRKWNRATKSCCCTWPRKSQETSHGVSGMKQVRALVLVLLIAGCSFIVTYRLSHTPQTPETEGEPEFPSQQGNSLGVNYARLSGILWIGID